MAIIGDGRFSLAKWHTGVRVPPEWHSGGQGFEPPRLHHLSMLINSGLNQYPQRFGWISSESRQRSYGGVVLCYVGAEVTPDDTQTDAKRH